MQTIYLKWYVVGFFSFFVTILVFLTLHVHKKGHIIKKGTDPEKLPKLPPTTRSESSSHTDSRLAKDDINTILTTSSTEKEYLKSTLIETARAVHRAKTYVRGTKSADALIDAMHLIDKMLNIFELDYKKVTRREVFPPQSVCPETYNGTVFGYPFFYKGFEKTSCPYEKPEEDLVTIVILFHHYQFKDMIKVFDEIQTYNRNITIIVGVYETADFSKESFLKMFSKALLKSYLPSITKGAIWNDLVNTAQTPYVLIARDLVLFNNDSRLHRLIREMERLNLDVAGGASRDINGYWNIGCLQRAYKNHSIVYEEGYHESVHECVFCDHLENSFVIRKSTFAKVKFDENIRTNGIFEDFFLRVKGESVVCPDSMFYVNRRKRNAIVSEWGEFAAKYNINKLKFLSANIELDFGCPDNFKCVRSTGYAVAPCCLNELAKMITFIMKTCEENGIVCELQEGTLLGAVKLHKVLPWERDADITFLSGNYSKMQHLKSIFEGAGYTFSDGGSLWCCVGYRIAGGKFKIVSKHWHAELYGQHLMDSELLKMNHLKPTKVPFHGHWVNSPRNPGLYARNRYGHEIYAHSQHWQATRQSSGWINYKTNFFTTCNKPGHHTCLDRYNGDGNIQFSDPIP